MKQLTQNVDHKIAVLVKHVRKAKKQSHLLHLMKDNDNYKNIEIMLNQVDRLFGQLRKEIADDD